VQLVCEVLPQRCLGKKAYGFCYDDVAEQAAFFSGKGKEVVVTLRWDSESKGSRPTRDAGAFSRQSGTALNKG